VLTTEEVTVTEPGSVLVTSAVFVAVSVSVPLVVGAPDWNLALTTA
jgi:hypothetical protein